MSQEACCTCATLLSTSPIAENEKTDKSLAPKQLDCCGRVICTNCIKGNERFGAYCLFCQVPATPSTLSQCLHDLPLYSPPLLPPCSLPSREEEEPPPYTSTVSQRTPVRLWDPKMNQGSETGEDVLHFLDFRHDTMLSLSLSYGVPIHALRSANRLWSDHLLSARRTVIVPSEYYKAGVSLSPRPIEGEEEEIRKAKVRRWMVACKVSEYNLALLYLKECNYDLETAINSYKADENWEKDHPLQGS